MRPRRSGKRYVPLPTIYPTTGNPAWYSSVCETMVQLPACRYRTLTDLLQQLGDMKTDGNILPPPSLSVEKRSLFGRDVAIVTVQPSDSPPVRFRGRVHIRVGPRRGVATAQDERILNEKRRYKDIPFDIQPIPSARLDDLDMVYFEHEYLSRAFAREMLEAQRT